MVQNSNIEDKRFDYKYCPSYSDPAVESVKLKKHNKCIPDFKKRQVLLSCAAVELLPTLLRRISLIWLKMMTIRLDEGSSLYCIYNKR